MAEHLLAVRQQPVKVADIVANNFIFVFIGGFGRP
jgi:hypothetical protein